MELYKIVEILFEIIPKDVQKKYELTIHGQKLTLKDQFISYCEDNGFTRSKYENEADLKRMLLYILMLWEETENKPSRFDLFIFNDIFI